MKFIKIIFTFFITLLFLNNAFWSDINISILDVDSSNSNLLKLYLDKDIISDSPVIEWDIKIFKDLETNSILKELENNNTVSISLSNQLESNTSYSLLSVYGVEWTIDFEISELINWLEILWNPENWIIKVNIIDSRNLKITFSTDIVWDDINIKLLKEYTINWISIDSNNNKVINIEMWNNIDPVSNYLIMLFSLNNINWNNYIVNNSIFDFVSLEKVEEIALPVIEAIIEEEVKTGNVALNSAETPETWAETWILLLFTFLLSGFVFIRSKSSK